MPKTRIREDAVDNETAYLQPTRSENLIRLFSRWLGIVVFVVALGMTIYMLTRLIF